MVSTVRGVPEEKRGREMQLVLREFSEGFAAGLNDLNIPWEASETFWQGYRKGAALAIERKSRRNAPTIPMEVR